MTLYEYVSSAISLVALLAVVVSLWFVRKQVAVMNAQTRQLNTNLETSAESTLDSLFIMITQAYLDYPALRPVFNEREAAGPVEITDPETRFRANALAESLLDAMERALNFEERDLPGAASQLRAWIADSFRHSAFLRNWLAENASWYSPKMSGILAEVTTEREARSRARLGPLA